MISVIASEISLFDSLSFTFAYILTKEGVKPYNLLHLNALYNLCTHTYEDAIVFKRKEAGENKALTEMVDRSAIIGKSIVIMDRGYES